jgi:hypothetical protein
MTVQTKISVFALVIIGIIIANYAVSNTADSLADDVLTSLAVVAVIIFWLSISTSIAGIIKKFKRPAQLIAEGDFTQRVYYNESDDIGTIANAINTTTRSITNATEFIRQIEKGNLNADYIGENLEKDALAQSLLSMRAQLINIDKLEKQRVWATEGLAMFADILRSESSLELLGSGIISNLVRYTGASQGGLFVLNDDKAEHPVLELLSFYAWEESRYSIDTIEPGEGLVGQAYLDKNTLRLSNIPNDYVKVSSGLGQTLPSFVVIVPLKINDIVFGVVELSALEALSDYKIEFIERVGESIAATIAGVKTNERTQRLLNESQEMTEQLRAQEEEMRQNMEELLATQEEMERKQKEIERSREALETAKTELEKREEKLKELSAQQEESIKLLEVQKKKLESNELILKRSYEKMKQNQEELVKKQRETQEMNEEMRSQEEELRQNLEELMATQEEMERKQQELEVKNQQLNSYKAELDGKIIELQENKERLMANETILKKAYEKMKQTQAENKASFAATAQREKEISALLNSLPGVVYHCLLDEHFTMKYVSDKVEELTGYTKQQFINGEISFGNIILPEDRASVDQQMEEAIGKNGYFEMKYRIKDVNGRILKVWERGRLYENEAEATPSLYGFITTTEEH